MSSLKGKVGPHELEWISVPKGPTGTAHVRIAGGAPQEVRWRKDADGIWIELAGTVQGYDVAAERGDDGTLTYGLSRRGGDQRWSGMKFMRAGEDQAVAGGGAKKKGVRVRAQMPGKIVRILVQKGAHVEKDQPLLVMEAMKMENEIRAAAAGTVADVKVTEGQAIETGADLILLS